MADVMSTALCNTHTYIHTYIHTSYLKVHNEYHQSRLELLRDDRYRL
jgi:hypothetical protein